MIEPNLQAGLFSSGLLAGGVAVSVGISTATAAVAWRSRRARSTREAEELRHALDTHRAECAAQLAALARNLESLEAGMRSSSGMLRDGRLNLSVRAQAIQLLRAGISPDAAALNLGVASRDVRLIARVSRLLAVR